MFGNKYCSEHSNEVEDKLDPVPIIDANLEIVNEEDVINSEMGWDFFSELIQDLLTEKENLMHNLKIAILTNDHTKLKDVSHSIKGAALSLYLPALSDIAKKLEIVGKQLNKTPNIKSYLDAREKFFNHLHKEYNRLQGVLPQYQAKE
jgi:HPt (histidine-containing phosphotransfer) domain-containing protein